MSQLNKLLSFIIGKPIGQTQTMPVQQLSAYKQAMRRRALIHQEAQIGGTLLGEVPAGHHREFFNLDQYTWVWSEQWKDTATKQPQRLFVQYDLRPSGVLKTVNGVKRGYLEGQELSHFAQAMDNYTARVAHEVYGQPVTV